MAGVIALTVGGLEAGVAMAGAREVEYVAAPTWLAPAPTPSTTHSPEGLVARVIYFDGQTRAIPGGAEIYNAYRVKVLKPEGLAIGNIAVTWNPSTYDFMVHSVKLIRGGQVIDVLAQSKFRVIERENNLDYAMLDGALTATLQVPGLQVGDELEFASTLRQRDATFGGKISGATQFPVVGSPGAFRMRLTWPSGATFRWQATPDLGMLKPQIVGSEVVLTEELRDPTSSVATDGAPARFNFRRLVQYSEFRTWAEVAQAMAPLYASAETLPPQSSIRAEAAKIAAAATDPTARAEAALRLVQDQIRYVFVGLDGGAYRPAPADETWKRRFGDCKAKTVVLVALLHELGIESEAVLVNSQGGDGLDERLPTPGAFDHVLVRVRIQGKSYWLDGTRLGDRRLVALPKPPSRWGLPIRSGATDLEAIPPDPLVLPQESTVLEVDASGGFDKPAKVTQERVVRGPGAYASRTQLAGLSAQDAGRAVKTYFHNDEPWIEPDTAAWRYDEAQGALVLRMTGTTKPDWEGDDKDGRSLDIYHAGQTPPNALSRPMEQDQTAPWLTEFPLYKRWTTIIRLPSATAKWRWAYSAAPMDEELGGVFYHRDAEMRDAVVRTTMSRRVYKPEISATEAAQIAERLPTFNNKISQVYQVAADKADPSPEAEALATIAKSQDPQALGQAGARLILAKRYDDGIRAFDKALSIRPKFAAALAAKGAALADKGDLDAALKLFDEANAADPKADIRLGRAEVLTRLGRKTEALDLLAAESAAHPGNASAAFYVAQGQVKAGAQDRALATIADGLKADAGNLSLLEERALLESQAGDLAAAVADADTAILYHPEALVPFLDRAKLLDRQKQFREAGADADEAWRMNPLDGLALTTRAQILAHLDRKSEALEMVNAWVNLDKTGSALNSRCWLRAEWNLELSKAEEDCADAVKLAPANANYWDSYALVALRSGRLEIAQSRYDHALSLDPKHAGSLYGRGIVKLRRGDKSSGDADIAAAKAISPTAGDNLAAAGVTAS